MRGEVITDQNSTHTNETYDQEQGFASDEEINCIRELCSAKGLKLPQIKDDVPFEAFLFWALPNTDYTNEQYLNDYDAISNLSIHTKWRHGYVVPDSAKKQYWKGSMFDTYTITTEMALRYIQGFYMNSLNRYAVQLAFSIQQNKNFSRLRSSRGVELDIATVLKEYNSKTKGDLIEMYQDSKIYLAHGPVQWVERL